MSVDLDKLTQPFPREAIKQRRSGGGTLSYVEGHSVIHRLNDATGNVWSMEVKDISSKDIPGINKNGQPVTNTLMIARVALTIPDHGTREGLGVQMVHEQGGEDLVKGCITDALKKAATLFGVGLELYGPDYEAGEVAPVSQPRDTPNWGGPSRPAPARPVADEDDDEPPVATPDQLSDVWALVRGVNMTQPHAQNFAKKHVGREIGPGMLSAQAEALIKELQARQNADLGIDQVAIGAAGNDRHTA